MNEHKGIIPSDLIHQIWTQIPYDDMIFFGYENQISDRLNEAKHLIHENMNIKDYPLSQIISLFYSAGIINWNETTGYVPVKINAREIIVESHEDIWTMSGDRLTKDNSYIIKTVEGKNIMVPPGTNFKIYIQK